MVKEESEKAGLKLNIKKKSKFMASSLITSWQIEGGKSRSSNRFYYKYFLFVILWPPDAKS